METLPRGDAQACGRNCRFFLFELLKIYLISRNVHIFKNRKKVLNHSTLLLGHWDLVVPLTKIQLAEDHLAGQLGQEVLYVGWRIHVLLFDQIQPPVVTSGPPGAIELLHHVQQ